MMLSGPVPDHLCILAGMVKANATSRSNYSLKKKRDNAQKHRAEKYAKRHIECDLRVLEYKKKGYTNVQVFQLCGIPGITSPRGVQSAVERLRKKGYII